MFAAVRHAARRRRTLTRVWAEAERLGLSLGLWFAWFAPLEDMLWNMTAGGFRRYKLDFANFHTRDELDEFMAKTQQVVVAGGRRFGINWDATENSPRMGYFFGREYGNIYLENRPQTVRTGRIKHVTYRPHLVLRDVWQLAHELNLNQIQIPVQNVDRVEPQWSNAAQYGHAYCFAIAMMGMPVFFQETQLYDESARCTMRPLIALYRRHREAILNGIVYPLGAQPDDASWTGLQSHDAEASGGYLVVFRELHNAVPRQRLALHFAAGAAVDLTDLRTDHGVRLQADSRGAVELAIPDPGDFLFLQYVLR